VRVTYDPAADAMYIYVSEGRVAETSEVVPNVMIDVTAEGELVGIELLAVSRRPGANPVAIALEIIGGGKAAA
jgi:uncharacterized protein YuzE